MKSKTNWASLISLLTIALACQKEEMTALDVPGEAAQSIRDLLHCGDYEANC